MPVSAPSTARGHPCTRDLGGGRCRPGRERGSVSVELAIAFPVVLLLVLLLIQAALWFYARSAALGAAQEGADAGRVRPASADRAATTARDFLTRTAHDLMSGTTVQTAGSATQISVRVTGTSVSLFPGLSGWSVDQSAVGPVERPSR